MQILPLEKCFPAQTLIKNLGLLRGHSREEKAKLKGNSLLFGYKSFLRQSVIFKHLQT